MNKIVVSNIGEITDFEKYSIKIGHTEIESFSDKELYDYCRFTGINARIWSRRFVAAIPEVARRGLYKKYGFYSVYEFASKVGGITNVVVNNALWLDEALKDRPILKSLIGEIGINKIRVVVRVATKETESFWAQKVKDMSKPALEVLVREIKKDEEAKVIKSFESENDPAVSQKYPGINLTGNKKDGLFDESELENNQKVQLFTKPDRINFSVPIDLDTDFQLRKFKLNLEKAMKEPVDWNSTLKELVKRAVL
jgi:hypothetical protein